MNPFLFLRGEFRRSWGGALALALVLAFAGSLSPAVSMMERSIRSGMAQAADAASRSAAAGRMSVRMLSMSAPPYLNISSVVRLPIGPTLGSTTEPSARL